MKFWAAIVDFYRLMVEPSGADRLFCFQPKRWYVAYPDGKRSVAMAYDVAIDYAKIFGGSIKREKK